MHGANTLPDDDDPEETEADAEQAELAHALEDRAQVFAMLGALAGDNVNLEIAGMLTLTEIMPGIDPARDLILRAMEHGASVVSANKALLATHGTDHYLVQRLLVARGRRAAAGGLIASGLLVFAQFSLFLLLGVLLHAHYGGRPFARGDEVLPTFVATELPGALAGLILAAIVAAALSPSLNSMASATLRDFWLPYVRPRASEAEQLRAGRAFTVLWGLLQIGVALLAQGLDSALNQGLAVLSYASGPTVGAFLLGAKLEVGLLLVRGEYRRLDLSGDPLIPIDRRLSLGLGLAF